MKRTDQLKSLVLRHGIPANLRSQIWPRLTTARKLNQENPTKYKELLTKVPGQDNSNPYDSQIEKDLHRTFPHSMQIPFLPKFSADIWFTAEEVQNSLRHILRAFSK